MQVGILTAEQLLGQHQHPGVVVFGKTEDLEDHLQRVRQADVDRKIALATLALQGFDRLSAQLVEPVLEPSNAGRLEPVVGQTSILAVLRRIHMDERLDLHLAAGQRFLVLQHRLRPVAEQLRVTLDFEDGGVIDHRPEAGKPLTLHSMDATPIVHRQGGPIPVVEVAPPMVVGEDVVGGRLTGLGHVILLSVGVR